MSAKIYLLRTLLFALVVVFFVLGLNFTVDPYGVTGVRRIPFFNEFKVDINEHTWLMKKYQPLFTQHNALILGNSRVELGISPSHTCFNMNGLDVYNLGIPGADVRMQLTYALNMVYQQPIQTVFLSVDFTDFISPQPQSYHVGSSLLAQSLGEFRDMTSGASNPNFYKVYFRDYLKSLFSLNALVASVRTIALQSRVSPDRDEAGFNPARDFEEAVRIEGPRALFEQKMFDLQNKYSADWNFRDESGRLDPAFEDIDEFLAIAAERGITVYLFTNPFHEEFWNLLRSRGLMPVYAHWMRSMEDLVRKHEDSSIFFWDFSGDSLFIHEAMPSKGVKSAPLQWFWEPAHYRQQLGDLMVNAMLSERCNAEVAFGRRVF